MIPFLSPDSEIVLDQISDMLADGDWIEYGNKAGDIYVRIGGVNSREDLLSAIAMLESYDLELRDSSDVRVVSRFNEFLESYLTDYHNYVEYVVCKSAEWEELHDWLARGNFFSVGVRVFSFDDTKNRVYFINKFVSCVAVDGVDVVASDDEGLDYVDNLFVLLLDF